MPFAVIGHWSPVELCMSILYKSMCWKVNPFYGRQIEIQGKTYSGWELEDVKNAEPLLATGKIYQATHKIHFSLPTTVKRIVELPIGVFP